MKALLGVLCNGDITKRIKLGDSVLHDLYMLAIEQPFQPALMLTR